MNDKQRILQWRYRSILVEFQKDGLLGEKYIDEEEVEAILNEEGLQGWELVTATLVPEGLLLCCKRGLDQDTVTVQKQGSSPLGAAETSEEGSPVGNIKIF
jgi:hypothetical protein